MKKLDKYTCKQCGESDYGTSPYCKCEREYEKSKKYNQPERSKREDSIPEETRKEMRQFLDETFERRMEIVEQLQKERDAVL